MSENILKKIIDNKTLKINHIKNKINIDSLTNKLIKIIHLLILKKQ